MVDRHDISLNTAARRGVPRSTSHSYAATTSVRVRPAGVRNRQYPGCGSLGGDWLCCATAVTARLPYCATALLRDCPTARLPYGATALRRNCAKPNGTGPERRLIRKSQKRSDSQSGASALLRR